MKDFKSTYTGLSFLKDQIVRRLFLKQVKKNKQNFFLRTNDIISTDLASIDPALGFQLDYEHFVFLRAGLGNFQKTTEFDGSKSLSIQPNFGVGFIFKGIQVDYALTNIGSIGNALFSNIFSIKIDYTFFRR